jgi:hypothetical protein
MAQHMVGDLEGNGIVSKAKATAGSVGVSGSIYATPANYVSNTALDARLAAISGTIYSQRVLDAMTSNDKVYAVRMNDDLTTV